MACASSRDHTEMGMYMKKIYIEGAGAPAGHYTPAVESGGFIYVSGQLPIDPFTGEKTSGDIKLQTLRVLDNIKLLLKSGGSGIEKIIKINIYLSDIGLWDEVNIVYAGFMGEHKPSRIVIPTGPLHYGFFIEIDAIAEV